MTTLSFVEIEMEGANLNKTSPLPDILGSVDLHAEAEFDDTLSKEESKYLNYGRINSIAPYTMQDDYDRVKSKKKFKGAVLENDFLKATFITDFGGRLWSLYDKVEKKELLYHNPVFQPGNLGLRNAWISGGAEWNIGTTGHSPHTLEPLFVARYESEDKTPGLKMYEWERKRQATYEIDASLPNDSKFLFIKITIINTQNTEVPMYWWSNIAVPEADDVRVITPAKKALYFDSARILSKQDFPYNDNIDKSYSRRIKNSTDMFFNIEKEDRKFIAALNKDGYGLIQTSTDLLKGRKLFLWGTSQGGSHWQEFLSVKDHKYIEIQAGLCSTQMEHLPMKPGEKLQWVEAYGAIEVDKDLAHGENWTKAYTAVEQELEKTLPRKKVEAALETKEKVLEKVSSGSGWAALENLRKIKAKEEVGQGFSNFSKEDLSQDQEYWRVLLEEGSLQEWKVEDYPAPYIDDIKWLELLKEAIKNSQGNWHSYLQLGVGLVAIGEDKEAYDMFLKSLKEEKNCWALANIGLLHVKWGEYEKAKEFLFEAVSKNPQRNIAIEAGKALLLLKRYKEIDGFFALLSEDIKKEGRIELIRLAAYIHDDRLLEAKKIFDTGLVVEDIREGDLAISDLWFTLHEKILLKEGVDKNNLQEGIIKKHPLPEEYDFRMTV